MGSKDPRIDAYIARAAPFAQPILRHLRKIVHAGCPEAEETMKWSSPHFMHKGMLCGMAAFKQHCAFGFWKGALIFEGDKNARREAMGHFGRITALSDLANEKALIGYVKKAVALNEAGVKSPTRSKAKGQPQPLRIPDYFAAALQKNKKALRTFEMFSPSKQKEYVQWLVEAKREETRKQRLAISIQWLAEGKARNWKYQNC